MARPVRFFFFSLRSQTFQKLIKFLNLQTQVPIVDPAMYIKRFAAKLDLGSKTNAVCMTALKV